MVSKTGGFFFNDRLGPLGGTAQGVEFMRQGEIRARINIYKCCLISRVQSRVKSQSKQFKFKHTGKRVLPNSG
jgi:hypothetical protein